MRIVIVDDHHAVGAGLAQLLALQHEILAVLADWHMLESFVEGTRTDLVLLDGTLPRCDIAKIVQHTALRTKVIVMTMYPNCSTWPGLHRMGAWGVVSKSLSPETFVAEVNRIAGLPHRQPDGDPDSRTLEPTSRDLEVLVGMGRGNGIKQIARDCGLARSTTSGLIREVLKLTRMTGWAAAVLFASDQGWIEPRVPPPAPRSPHPALNIRRQRKIPPRLPRAVIRKSESPTF